MSLRSKPTKTGPSSPSPINWKSASSLPDSSASTPSARRLDNSSRDPTRSSTSTTLGLTYWPIGRWFGRFLQRRQHVLRGQYDHAGINVHAGSVPDPIGGELHIAPQRIYFARLKELVTDECQLVLGGPLYPRHSPYSCRSWIDCSYSWGRSSAGSA